MAQKDRNRQFVPLLKDFPDSRKMNKISNNAECLYCRLLAVADDNGNFYGHQQELFGKLFSAKRAEKICADDILQWRKELESVGLIEIFEHDGEPFVHILDVFRVIRKDLKSVRVIIEADDHKSQAVIEWERANRKTGSKPKSTPSRDPQQDPTDSIVFNQNFPNVFMEYWNSVNGLPVIKAMSKGRIQKLKTRMQEDVFSHDWKKIIRKLSRSPFHTGSNDRKWKATVDWILQNDTNYMKILDLEEFVDPIDDALGTGDATEEDVEAMRKAGIVN